MSDEKSNSWNLNEDTRPESLIAAEFIPSIPEAHGDSLLELESLAIANENGEPKAFDTIKRILHTFKGDFGVVGLDSYVELIHNCEELFLNNLLKSDSLLFLKDFLESSFAFFKVGKIPLIDDNVVRQIFEGHWDESESEPDFKDIESSGLSSLDQERNALSFFVEDPSLLQDFVVESGEQIQESMGILNKIASGDYPLDDVNTIFRACHTLKGISGFLNLKTTQNYAHALEDVLSLARRESIVLDEHRFDAVQLAFDHLEELIEGFNSFLAGNPFNLPENLDQNQAILKQIHDLAEGVKTEQTPMTPHIDFESSENLVDELVKPIDDSARSVVKVDSKPKIKDRRVDHATREAFNNGDESIRVSTKRLDLLIDSIGESVIAFSMLQADSNIKDSNDLILEKKMAQADLLIRQMQEISMSLRMVPVNATFQKMARIVRDLSKKLGKQVRFETHGEDTELDKGVVEKIGDPLMHMVRNSLDHGIETAEERALTNKDPIAKVILRSYNKGGSIFIEIEDDGRGIDRNRIIDKAVNQGLIEEGAGQALSDSEVFRYIFHPGFSTAAHVTDISGRGVGMDVVKKNIEALRGSVSIESTLGKGTLFSIRLPLTMAIIDGMVVKNGQEKFIIPTLNIITTIGYTNENVVRTPQGETLVEIQEDLVRIIELNYLLGFDRDIEKINEGVIVVVEDTIGGKLGLLVDEIIGQQQIVIKGFGKWLGELDGISGGAIMNDGNVSLILDMMGLSGLYGQKQNLEMIES